MYRLRLTASFNSKLSTFHLSLTNVMTQRKAKKEESVLQRMHPLHRLFVSLGLSLIFLGLIVKHHLNPLMTAMLTWIVFALSYNLISWVVLFTRSIHGIKKAARLDDGSKVFVFAMVLVSSFASLFTVLLLMISGNGDASRQLLFIPVAIAGMLLSWIMVHTIFTFHYAHMYYDDAVDSDMNTAQGLEFPGSLEPDYLDFAYFSFVIGSTFQVSDVQVTSRKIRRLVFVHGLIAFALNTFVVALTINLIAGLNK